MKWIVAVTGASGSIYASRLADVLSRLGIDYDMIISESGRKVVEYELGIKPEDLASGASALYDNDDLFAPPASGSAGYLGMFIVPCSMSTLSKIATGIADTLITRAASVCLKEGRKLILVPRETPLSIPMMRAMLDVAQAGATVMPAMPAFYHRPREIDDLVGHFVGRVLYSAGIENREYIPWEGGD